MNERRRRKVGFAVVLGLCELASACGLTSGGETGSETHWLATCQTNLDCAIGQCLCGVCSEPCSSVLDCPSPLDVCSAASVPDASACATSICRSSQPGEIATALSGAEQVDACDSGRPTSLVLRRDHATFFNRVAENDALGFLLWNGNAVGDGVLGLSRDGQLLRNHRQPSDLSPLFNAIQPLAEGSLLLAGSVADFDGSHGWIGKIDAAWNPTWETQLAKTFDTSDLVALPDGGALVRGATFTDADPPAGEWWTPRAADEWWVRIAATGEVVWQQSAAFTLALPTGVGGIRGPRQLMALTPDEQLRIAVVTTDGTKLIFGALDGTSEVRSLDTTMADVRRLLALPDGHLALAGNDSAGQPHLALLEADGSLTWERSYGSIDQVGRGNELNAFAFDAVRNELLVVGNVMTGSWMLAVDLTGDVDWELQRKPSPTNFDGDVLQVRPGEGPELTDVAIAADGNVLATGSSNRGLVYFMVGAGSCN